MADLEFVKLKNELRQYESTVTTEIRDTPETVQLNKASLMSYIQTSKSLAEIDKKISSHLKVPVEENNELISGELIDKLIGAGIKTIKELDKLVAQNKDEIVDNIKKDSPKFKGEVVSIVKGMGLYNITIKMLSKQHDR